MKVMISTDMEGVSGIVSFGQVMKGASDFERGRRWFTHDVNAAVQGCIDAGATQVLITDNHAAQINILYEDLHPEAELIVGGGQEHRPSLVMDGLDSSFGVVILLGYHTAAHQTGILAHSYGGSPHFYEIEINGLKVGETEIAAMLAGDFGVPVGMLTGDDKAVEAAKEVMPDIEGVVVKWTVDYHAARLLSMAKTGPMIREAAKRACERASRGEFKPWIAESPVRMDVTVGNHGLAAKLAAVPGAERIGARSVRFEDESYGAVYDALLTYVYIIEQDALRGRFDGAP